MIEGSFLRKQTCLFIDVGNGVSKVKDLRLNAGLSYSNVLRILKHWENCGLINREIGKQKTYIISLTEKGEKLLTSIRYIKDMASSLER